MADSSTTPRIPLETPPTDGARTFLRHTVATLAYRAGKTLRDAPPEFADYELGPGTRTPRAIVAHMGDLFDWALTMARGQTVWREAPPSPWANEVTRFFDALAAFDAYLASSAPITPAVLEKLFQGPVADALTHTGQLALLRRRADAPVRAENYARAEIVVGRTGIAQAPARSEFD
jgi:hypothetical protein